MLILIDNKSGAPIYDQIFTQIKGHILSGELKTDEPLPSIRGLAKDLRISVITTKRAYDELERAGYLYTVEGNASSKTIDTNGGTIAQKVYHVSDKYIVAICCPNYITLGNVRPAVVSAYVPCRCHDQQNLLDAPDELQFIQNPLILYER